MKKKVLLIVCSIIIVISIFIVLVFVNQQSTTESTQGDGDNLGYDYSDNYTDNYEEETTQTIKLSNSCDKILATGSNKNGDFYELVANQEETYDNVKIKIGVIKNNEWLLEPTSNMPFIDKETGLIKIEGFTEGSKFGIDDVKIEDYETDNVHGTFEYVADGCFCIYKRISKDMSWSGDPQCSIIYNAENKKSYYNTYNNNRKESIFIYTSSYKNASYGNQLLIQKRYSIGGNPVTEYRSDFFILDTNTMETKVIVEDTEYNIVGPIGDGLFAVGDAQTNYTSYGQSLFNESIMYFYDLKGNQVIDLTSYNDGGIYGGGRCFVDGQFTFRVKNNVGTEFQVTIDTKGNVISSVENPKEE